MDGDQFRPCAAAGQSYPDLEKGEHTFAVRATDAAGTADPTPATHAWTIDAAAPRTADTMPTSRALGVATTTETGVTFGANADARVARANPGSNYGTGRRLITDREPVTESYLRFEVSGVDGTVTRANLQLYAPEGTVNGPAVFPAGNAWAEGSITWNSRPERTSTVAADDKGPIASNTWVAFDVTSLVAGDGTYTFNLASTSRDAVYFHSKEAADASLRPRLVLTVDATATGRHHRPDRDRHDADGRSRRRSGHDRRRGRLLRAHGPRHADDWHLHLAAAGWRGHHRPGQPQRGGDDGDSRPGRRPGRRHDLHRDGRGRGKRSRGRGGQPAGRRPRLELHDSGAGRHDRAGDHDRRGAE